MSTKSSVQHEGTKVSHAGRAGTAHGSHDEREKEAGASPTRRHRGADTTVEAGNDKVASPRATVSEGTTPTEIGAGFTPEIVRGVNDKRLRDALGAAVVLVAGFNALQAQAATDEQAKGKLASIESVQVTPDALRQLVTVCLAAIAMSEQRDEKRNAFHASVAATNSASARVRKMVSTSASLLRARLGARNAEDLKAFGVKALGTSGRKPGKKKGATTSATAAVVAPTTAPASSGAPGAPTVAVNTPAHAGTN